MNNEKNELVFTLVLVIACLLAYISVLIPAWSDVFDCSSFVMSLGLPIVIVASHVIREAQECTNQN